MTQIIDYSEKAIAVIGDTKEIKDSLKELGGRFNFRLSCGAGWIFPKSKLEDVKKLLDCGDVLVAEKKMQEARFKEVPIDELREEFTKVWKNDKKMVEWCLKNHSVNIRLSNGKIISFDKPHIDTEFWVGYSDVGQGLSYDEANEVTANINKNLESCFLEKNLKECQRCIDLLCGGGKIYIARQYDRVDNNFVTYYVFTNECNDNFLRLKKFAKDFQEVTNQEDIDLIKWAANEQKTRFEKRLRTYLKRFGTSKMYVNTYWVDR